MTIRYLFSGAAGGGTGADWPNAFTTMNALAAVLAAGDLVYIAHSHNPGSQNSNTTWAIPTGTGLPVDAVVVDDSAASSSYTVAHTPAASTIVGSPTALETFGSTATINIPGNINLWGFKVQANNTITLGSAVDEVQKYSHCKFTLVATTAKTLVLGAATGASGMSGRMTLREVDVILCNNAGSLISINGCTRLDWRGGSVVHTTTQPTAAFNVPSTIQANSLLDIRDVDMSDITGKWIDVTGAPATFIRFEKCKSDIALTPSRFGIAVGDRGSEISVRGCGPSGSTASFFNMEIRAAGTVITDTSVNRTGGASDGTTAFSCKVTANASSNIANGNTFRFKIADDWWDTNNTSLRTFVAQRSGQTRLTDAQFWIEAEFVRTGEVWGKVMTSQAADQGPLNTGTTWTADSGSSWSGLSTPVVSQADVTPSGDQSGPVSIWGVLAFDNSGANAEIWVDPYVKQV